MHKDAARAFGAGAGGGEGELEAWVYFSTKNGDQVRVQAFPHADIAEKPKQHTFYLRKCSRPECGCNEIADRLLSVYAAAAVLHAMAVAGAKFTGELGKILHGPDAEKRGYPAPDRGIAIFAGGRGYSEIAADAGVSLNSLVDLYGNAVFLLETPLRWPRWAREVLPPKAYPKTKRVTLRTPQQCGVLLCRRIYPKIRKWKICFLCVRIRAWTI